MVAGTTVEFAWLVIAGARRRDLGTRAGRSHLAFNDEIRVATRVVLALQRELTSVRSTDGEGHSQPAALSTQSRVS